MYCNKPNCTVSHLLFQTPSINLINMFETEIHNIPTETMAKVYNRAKVWHLYRDNVMDRLPPYFLTCPSTLTCCN